MEKKLLRGEKYAKFTASQSSPGPASVQPLSFSPSTSISDPDSSDEFIPKRQCTPATGTTITIPPDILKKIGPAADRMGSSNNVLIGTIATIVNHCGGDIDDLSLSKSTARRHRQESRSVAATKIKDDFVCNDVCQVNFDAKLLTDLGGFGSVNRLAINLVQEHSNQILAIAKTENGTGEVEARAVAAALEEWGLSGKVVASGFDTTSSNTGVHKGGCVILQGLLDRQILWLACRHHILELILRGAYHEVMGGSKAPTVALFKILKVPATWNSLDLDDLQLPSIPPSFLPDVPKILAFIDLRLLPENEHLLPRCDYKEFLELAKLFLGGSVGRKKGWFYKLTRPGADHHARWMSKAIYILKLALLAHQLNQSQLSWQKKQKIHLLALWVVFCYMESWFRSPSLEDAAYNDLQLLSSLLSFNKVPGKLSKKITAKTVEILRRHTWYFAEELIPIVLFSDKVGDAEKQKIAEKIGKLPSVTHPVKKPALPPISTTSALSDFVGPRSTILFQLLGESHTFLAKDEWHLLPQLEDIRRSLLNLTPLNDSCERALALATKLNGTITKDEQSWQELVRVVAKHQEKFPMFTKQDLKKFY